MNEEEFQELKKLSLFKGEVVSNSMSPIIKQGETVIVEVGQKDLRRFDIVVIFLDGKLVCHYLWQMNKIVQPPLLQTRNVFGQDDFPILESEYLGKVISHQISFFRKVWLSL